MQAALASQQPGSNSKALSQSFSASSSLSVTSQVCARLKTTFKYTGFNSNAAKKVNKGSRKNIMSGPYLISSTTTTTTTTPLFHQHFQFVLLQVLGIFAHFWDHFAFTHDGNRLAQFNRFQFLYLFIICKSPDTQGLGYNKMFFKGPLPTTPLIQSIPKQAWVTSIRSLAVRAESTTSPTLEAIKVKCLA